MSFALLDAQEEIMRICKQIKWKLAGWKIKASGGGDFQASFEKNGHVIKVPHEFLLDNSLDSVVEYVKEIYKGIEAIGCIRDEVEERIFEEERKVEAERFKRWSNSEDFVREATRVIKACKEAERAGVEIQISTPRLEKLLSAAVLRGQGE